VQAAFALDNTKEILRVRKLIAAAPRWTREQLADPSVGPAQDWPAGAWPAAELSDCSARGGVNNPIGRYSSQGLGPGLVAENLAARGAR